MAGVREVVVVAAGCVGTTAVELGGDSKVVGDGEFDKDNVVVGTSIGVDVEVKIG